MDRKVVYQLLLVLVAASLLASCAPALGTRGGGKRRRLSRSQVVQTVVVEKENRRGEGGHCSSCRRRTHRVRICPHRAYPHHGCPGDLVRIDSLGDQPALRLPDLAQGRWLGYDGPGGGELGSPG